MFAAHGIEVVAQAADADDLRRILGDVAADVLVTDVRMPPGHATDGLEAAIEVRRDRPGFPVVVLSQYVEQAYARELLADGAGAVGYLLKDRVMDVEEFVSSVRRVVGGGTVLDPEVVAKLVTTREAHDGMRRLSPREREVLGLMAQGRSNAAIAASLVVTEKAVGKHIGNIFTKLDLYEEPDANRRVLAVLQYLQGG